MAVINYTIEQNVPEGWVKLTWNFSSSGEVSPFPNQDEGQAFDCDGLLVSAAVTSGDFGGVNDNGKIDVLGSHLVSPANFFSLFTFDRTTGESFGIKPQLSVPSYLQQIKPTYNRNNRAVSLTVLLVRT
jgi:hypothetical protein